ncbi:MAG TPA: serine hydrolase domain-containing protein [Gemmatimonadales bacterium]|nr:serine hydrolase domain-containing protein [Gemmatimonadales bacterium]
MRAVLLVLPLVAACGRGRPEAPVPLSALAEATAYLDSAVAAGAAPGAVLGVSVGGQHLYHATGVLGAEMPARPDSSSVYDLASLTKVIGLTTAVMMAVDEGKLELDAPAVRYVPAFTGDGRDAVTIRHLLTHTSGLPAFRLLYRETGDAAAALALTDTTRLDTLPGASFVYSDLGAIVLTQAVEAALGERLDSILARRVFGPLGMTSTQFLPPADWLPRIAPTEQDPWRGRMIHGEVHDENASRLGGVSGHAGLFGTARDLLVFGDWLLATRAGRDSLPVEIDPAIVRRFTRRQDLPRGSSRALGWDTPSERSSAGTLLSNRSFGHTGFTGTSIWLDPERDLVIVLLSNRVHPTRENGQWGPVRRNVADRVARGIGHP